MKSQAKKREEEGERVKRQTWGERGEREDEREKEKKGRKKGQEKWKEM